MIYKFTIKPDLDFFDFGCDQTGDVSGEYIPLVEYQELQAENARLRETIHGALEIADNIDGAHHKQWIIDQMVRVLTNCPIVEKKALDYKGNPYSFRALGESDEYIEWIKDYQNGKDGPATYEWDTGIAP